jgi:hypothetical protein
MRLAKSGLQFLYSGHTREAGAIILLFRRSVCHGWIPCTQAPQSTFWEIICIRKSRIFRNQKRIPSKICFVFEGRCLSCEDHQSYVKMRHPADEALYVGGHEEGQFPFILESSSEVL